MATEDEKDPIQPSVGGPAEPALSGSPDAASAPVPPAEAASSAGAPEAPVQGARTSGAPVPPAGATASGVPVPPEGVPASTASASPAAPAAPSDPGSPSAPTTATSQAMPAPASPVPRPVATPDAPQAPQPAKRGANKKVVAIAIAVAVIVVAIATFFSLRGQAAQAARLSIGTAGSDLVSADGELVEIDLYTGLDYASLSLSSTSDPEDVFSSAGGYLDKAQSALNEAKSREWALDGGDRNAIDALQASIDARWDMIDTGKAVVDAMSDTYAASRALVGYYSDLMSFWDSTNDVVDTLNASNDINAIDTSTLADQVAQAQQCARDLADGVKTAKETVPDADLSTFQAVVDKCSSLADLLGQISTATASRDAGAFNSLSETYNATKDEAIAAMNAVPTIDGIADLLVTDQDKELAEAYQEARNAAVDALKPLDLYMGADLSDLTERSALLD